MAYCTNCGKELKDGAIRCLHCGEYHDSPVKGNSPSGIDDKRLRTDERSFKYSPIFYIVIILDILTCLLFGWACFSLAFTGEPNLKSVYIIWGTIFLFNLIFDTVLLNNIKDYPHAININLCWIKSLFGFLGIFTAIFGLYFLIISLAMRRVSPQMENYSSKDWYNKGVEFSESHEYESALAAYDHALSLNDKDPDIWNNKCFVLIKLGRYEEAINAGETGINLAPHDREIRDTLRNAYLANHNPEKAAECENKLSSLRTGSAGKDQSDNTGKNIGICCGFFILLFGAIALINNWGSIGNNVSNLIHTIIFVILLIGILYEGWKAVKS